MAPLDGSNAATFAANSTPGARLRSMMAWAIRDAAGNEGAALSLFGKSLNECHPVEQVTLLRELVGKTTIRQAELRLFAETYTAAKNPRAEHAGKTPDGLVEVAPYVRRRATTPPQRVRQPTSVTRIVQKALLDAETIEGVPIRKCSKGTALTFARKSDVRSRWLRLLCDRVPRDTDTIGDFNSDRDAEKAHRLAMKEAA